MDEWSKTMKIVETVEIVFPLETIHRNDLARLVIIKSQTRGRHNKREGNIQHNFGAQKLKRKAMKKQVSDLISYSNRIVRV